MVRYQTIDVTPVLDTSAYTSGDRVGAIHTITGAGHGFRSAVLESIAIIDKDAQGAALKVHFFDALPTVASADNAAIDISDAEAVKYTATVSIATTDYVSTASNKLAFVLPTRPIPMCLLAAHSGVASTLYAVVTTSGSPTYTASGLVFRYTFRYED